MDRLVSRGVRGGAYLGVGPAQNFSYVAAIQPAVAFMVDVRRDNALQHLLFKALFEASPTRAEYLGHLLGRAPPADSGAYRSMSLEQLVAHYDASAGDPPARALAVVRTTLGGVPIPLRPEDWATIERFHRTFMQEGLNLRFNTFGRAPQPYYPTLRRLLLERDLSGSHTNYLADDTRYQVVRRMHLENRIIPVVGDLGGTHALSSIASFLHEVQVPVSAVYTSNVEFYLVAGVSFTRFVDNLAALPHTDRSLLIRSVFGRSLGRHPQTQPGYASVQVLQTVESLVATYRAGGYRSYVDLVTRDALPLP